MVEISGGKFTPSFFNEEREVFDIEVCKYQTTQDMWEEIMGDNPSEFKGGRRPVEKITWWQCLEYCNKLSEKCGLEPVYDLSIEGSLKINQIGEDSTYPNLADLKKTEGFRLPTEVEWEWFSRGGEVAIQDGTFDYKYSGSDKISEVAWYSDNSGSQTHDVGLKKPNQLGIYDCSGNVNEWCYDTYSSGYISEDRPYIYDASINSRVLKGGSWRQDANFCELSHRIYGYATSCYNNVGFRLVRTI